jgi:hypothetical protein
MFITSAGIYGFLSNAYQQTANKLELHDGALSVLDGKKTIFEKNILDNENIINTKNKRVDKLSELRTNQEIRLDSARSNGERARVRLDIKNSDIEIQKLTNEIDELNGKNSILSDSINVYNTNAIELTAGSDVAAEVGPLKYISNLTGSPMDVVVNYLILLLIFVFDPLAIALILITNRVFELNEQVNPIEPKRDAVNDVVNYVVNDVVNDGVNDVVNDGVNDEGESINIIEKPIETEDTPITFKKTPVVPTGKIEVEDIKEVKERDRGYSVKVPQPKTNNTIERIGSNKVIKDGDDKTFFYTRK